jgi:hypothetical protein
MAVGKQARHTAALSRLVWPDGSARCSTMRPANVSHRARRRSSLSRMSPQCPLSDRAPCTRLGSIHTGQTAVIEVMNTLKDGMTTDT